MPHGRSPTFTDPVAALVALSITITEPARPVDTKTRFPSGDTTTPIGLTLSPVSLIVFTTLCFAVSTTDTVPPFSDVTYAWPPSGEKADPRGRGGTSKCVITRLAAVSIAVTRPSPSDVT